MPWKWRYCQGKKRDLLSAWIDVGVVGDIPQIRNYINGTEMFYVIPAGDVIYPHTAQTIVFYNMIVEITVKHDIDNVIGHTINYLLKTHPPH